MPMEMAPSGFGKLDGPPRRLACFGAPCGATKFVSKWFRAYRLNVGHEQTKPEGRVCGIWAVDDSHRRPPCSVWVYASFDPKAWTHLGVVMRPPLPSSETMADALDMSCFDFSMPQQNDLDAQLNSLRYWVVAHRENRERYMAFEGPKFVVRVDNRIYGDLAYAHKLLDLPLRTDRPMPERDPRKGGKRYPAVTMQQWVELDPEYAGEAGDLIHWANSIRQLV